MHFNDLKCHENESNCSLITLYALSNLNIYIIYRVCPTVGETTNTKASSLMNQNNLGNLLLIKVCNKFIFNFMKIDFLACRERNDANLSHSVK